MGSRLSGRVRYSRSKSPPSTEEAGSINSLNSGSLEKVSNINNFGNGWDINNPITLSSDDEDDSESDDNHGNQSEHVNNSESESDSSNESEEIPLSQIKFNKNEREIGKLKLEGNTGTYHDTETSGPSNFKKEEKLVNRNNKLRNSNSDSRKSSFGTTASTRFQLKNENDYDYDIPLSKYTKRATAYANNDSVNPARSILSHPVNRRLKKSTDQQNELKNFEITDDYLDEEGDIASKLAPTSRSSSFEIIDEDEGSEEREENSTGNGREATDRPKLRGIPNARIDPLVPNFGTNDNEFSEGFHEINLHSKNNLTPKNSLQENEMKNSFEKLLVDNNKSLLESGRSKESMNNDYPSLSKESFVIPDDDINIFLVSSSSSSSDSSSLEFESDQSGEFDSSDDYESHYKNQEKNNLEESSKEKNMIVSNDSDDEKLSSLMNDKEKTNISMNEDNKINNLLEDIQPSSSSKQQEFDNLSNSMKMTRLEQLVQKSKIFSQIIADTLLQSSLERKKLKENVKEDLDNSLTAYHKDKDIDQKRNSFKPNNPRSTRGRKSKKNKNDSGIISMYSGATSSITEETLKTKEKLTNANAGTREQPKLIKDVTLRDYQLDGLDWLVTLYENGLNGILADEMGLGKTLQLISLLAFLYENDNKGPFLVACPLSTVGNWYKEVSRFAPDIPCLKYAGSKEEREHIRLKYFKPKKQDRLGIVITSYEIILRDRRYLDKFKWKFLIVDEGHRLKNINSKLIKELKKLKTENRLLLTGTPLQNNLDELWSLLNFILPDIFQDIDLFHQWFNFSPGTQEGIDNEIITSKIQAQLVENLHTILKPFILRRLKKVVIKSLPPKREYIIYCKLSTMQAQLYESALNKTFRTTLPYIAFQEYISVNELQIPKEMIKKFIDAKIFKISPPTQVIDLHNDDDASLPISNRSRRVVKPINYKESRFNQFEGDVSDEDLVDVNVYKNNYYEKDELYVDETDSNSKMNRKRIFKSENQSHPQKRIKLLREERALNDFRNSNKDIPAEFLNVFDINISTSRNASSIFKDDVSNKFMKTKEIFFINFLMEKFLTLLDKKAYDFFMFHNEKKLYEYSELFTDIFELSVTNENLIHKEPYLKEVVHQIQLKGDRLIIDNSLFKTYENKMRQIQETFIEQMPLESADPNGFKANLEKNRFHSDSTVLGDMDALKKKLENDLLVEGSQIRKAQMQLLVQLDTLNLRHKHLLEKKDAISKKFYNDWKQFLAYSAQAELFYAKKCQTQSQREALSQRFYNIKNTNCNGIVVIMKNEFGKIRQILAIDNERKRQIELKLSILSMYRQIEFLNDTKVPSFELIFQKFVAPNINLNEQIIDNFKAFCDTLVHKGRSKTIPKTKYAAPMQNQVLNELSSENKTESELKKKLSDEDMEQHISLNLDAEIPNKSRDTNISLSNGRLSQNLSTQGSNIVFSKDDISEDYKENLTILNSRMEEDIARNLDNNNANLLKKDLEDLERISKDEDHSLTHKSSNENNYSPKIEATKQVKGSGISNHHDLSVDASSAQIFEKGPTLKSNKEVNPNKEGKDRSKVEPLLINNENINEHDVGVHMESLKNAASKSERNDNSLSDNRKVASSRHVTASLKKKYTAALNKAWEDISNEIKYKNYGNLMMQLRSICDSPYTFFFPWMDENNVSRNLIENSGKMQILDQLLTNLLTDNHKVLIFSQFTTMLDLIEDYLTYKDLDRCRLDGTSSQAQREKTIKRFYDDDECMIFLLSTRAGGLGINLVAADTVIIFDSDWNPQVDLQAMDRAHRLGQTKPVIVYRLTTMNTIEQLLLARADTKRNLEKVVIQLGEFESLLKSNSSSMNSKELQKFLKANVFQANSDIKDNKLSKEELDELLDRSDASYKPRTCILNHLELFNSSNTEAYE